MPSQTAESILVRQEGSEVLFLNELKFRKNSALNLRIPLDNKNVPTVMAVVGQTGFVEGADYRQLPTVAFVRAIPDSPWFFVAHMETSEVYSSMPVILWTLFSFLMLLIFMMGAIFFGKRQAEAISAIQESQRVLKESQSVAQIGSYVFDLVTGFWKSSNELDRLFGLDAAFVRNYESWANLLHPDDRAMMETYFNNEVLGKKSAFNRQYRIITRDSGISRWVHGLGRLGFDAKGRPIEMIGTIQDISDYKRTEIELLKQAEAKEVLRLETLRAKERSDFLSEATKLLASTLEHEITFKKVAALAVPQLADVCTVYDSSLRRLAVAHVDPQKLNLLAEMDRRFPLDPRQPSIFQRVMRSGRSERVANMSAGILQGISQSAEHLEMLKQIGVRTALVIPLWHRCKALGVMLVGSTSARQFNEAEQVLAEELALRGAMAMDNAYLYREAQESIRARETILGVVSHDLKNPLAAIHLSAQLLKRLTDKFEDATITSMVQTIFGATEQMKRLIQDLLDLSKIQSRRLSIEKEKLRPELLVSSALDLMKSQALLKGLALSAEVEPDLPELACDKLRILQVFSNLLGNAIKFTEKGGRVKISVTRQGDAVRFSVSDTGSGISEAELPKIFERFWQTEKTKALGAGLGLSIVRGIVEAHGGSVSVESRVGVGSTFSFVLPISVALRLPIEQSAPVANLRVTNADLRADSDPQHKGLGGESPTLNQNQKS